MLHAQIVGNIGSDPQLQYTPAGQGFLRFNVASNYRVRSQSGEWSDATEWIRCTLFGTRAETLASLLHKGMRVFVDGRLEARPWTDREGQLRSGLELLANDIEFMSPRSEDGGQAQRPSTRNTAGPEDDLESVPF